MHALQHSNKSLPIQLSVLPLLDPALEYIHIYSFICSSLSSPLGGNKGEKNTKYSCNFKGTKDSREKRKKGRRKTGEGREEFQRALPSFFSLLQIVIFLTSETGQLFILALVVSSSLQGGMMEQAFNYFILFFSAEGWSSLYHLHWIETWTILPSWRCICEN